MSSLNAPGLRTNPESLNLVGFPGSTNVFWEIFRAVANIASQKKRNRQNEKRRISNVGVRSELKTRIKNAHAAIAAGDETVEDAIKRAQKRLGKASTKGVLHKNQAARRTSRLMKAANRAAQD